MRLTQVIDQTLGYVAPTSQHDHAHEHCTGSADAHAAHHTHQDAHALPKLHPSNTFWTSTVQERWVDHADEWSAWERDAWKREGDQAIKRANEDSLREAQQREKSPAS